MIFVTSPKFLCDPLFAWERLKQIYPRHPLTENWFRSRSARTVARFMRRTVSGVIGGPNRVRC